MTVGIGIKPKYCIWSIAYCLFFVSAFVSDIAFSNELLQDSLVKAIRYLAYFLLAFHVLKNTRESKREYIIQALFLGILFCLSLFTDNVYYVGIMLLIIASKRIDSKTILTLSYWVLIIATGIIVFLSLIGVVPMIQTYRVIGDKARLGLGFYHSNVLPLILFYLIVYRIFLDRDSISKRRVVLWVGLNMILYFLCGSRNGFVSSLILCLGVIAYQHRMNRFNKLFYYISKYSVVFLAVFSIIMTIIAGRGGQTVSIINRLMSNRFSISHGQYLRMGFHPISLMSNQEYIAARSVIDNGYLFVAFRYGYLFLLFYFFIHKRFSDKYRYNQLFLVCSITIALANMIDNDLLSYGYIPFILLALCDSGEKESKKDAKQKGENQIRAVSNA